MIKECDSIEFIKLQADYSTDIIYADPPYGLGSEVIIRPDGKPDYKKASDFMSKWKMPTGEYWEKWFRESFRVLKFGGRVIMYGMDRQLVLPKYYALLSGFEEQQSLYWYFISNFPKASDLSKNIDKHFGEKRKVVGKCVSGRNLTRNGHKGDMAIDEIHQEPIEPDITIPTTELAKKYDGYKYSISPLKQTNETILIFQKPYSTGSCLHDTLDMENGRTDISCGALNIDGGRVETKETICNHSRGSESAVSKGIYGDSKAQKNHQTEGQTLGRYPAQTFVQCICDKVITQTETIQGGFGAMKIGISDTGKNKTQDYDSTKSIRKENTYNVHTNPDCPCYILDKQSGMSKSSGGKSGHTGAYQGGYKEEYFGDKKPGFGDVGGCSKILHSCKYDKEEYDIYMYCSKVSKKERNAGLESFEEKEAVYPGANTFDENGNRLRKDGSIVPPLKAKNNHPTLKPISLNQRILQLFKTPNPQKILYPFAGVGSEIIGGIKVGFTDWEACEINPEYIAIAEARIKYWTKGKDIQPTKTSTQSTLF